MAVYYKFKSAKDHESIPIEGQFISVANLKERIFESKHLGRGTDYNLMISNAQSNEEYVDETAMIPKNTSVLIRRVPGRPRKPIVTLPDEPKIIENTADELPPQGSMLVGDSSTAMKYPEESEWDEFGNDLYAIPDVVATQSNNPQVDITPASKIDEENKIKALVETPALDWSRQGQDGFGGGRGFGRGMGGRMMAGRGFGRAGFERSGFERKTPPVGYICHRCKIPGHFIQHCPTNGDPNYDVRKMKPPTGIPKSMLMATPDGSYSLPSGAVAVLKPNEAAFEKEMEGMPSTRPVSDLPPELRCPLCKEVMKDAVLTSKCCFRSFCDSCIRDYIISKSMCVCGATNILADDLLPNKTLRETISRIMESTTSSAENVGSLAQVQDMEYSRHVAPKIPSPALSAASKDEPKQTPHPEHNSDMKADNAREGDAASKGKVVANVVHSSEKKTIKKTDRSEATLESMSTKEPTSPVSARVPEEGQEKLFGDEQGKKKKKKKIQVPGTVAADMQWRGFHDFGAENYAGMPLGPSVCNPYWGGGMPMGIDGFMPPFGGAMPYMGYVPGPFDVPFGGMMPPDPFAAQGFMMPAFPRRDLFELGCNNMNMNRGPPMSREEFEAMKADIRRKREREQLNEREHSRDGRRIGKEASSSGADVSSMKEKARLMSKTERPDRSERNSDLDCHGEPSRHSPLPPSRTSSNQRSSERDERDRLKLEEKAGAPVVAEEQESRSDRKLKGSVFSRISFPGSDKEMVLTSKKRKTTSSSSDANGAIKDYHHYHHHHRHHRDEMATHREGSVTSNGYRRNSYEQELSDEDEEEEEDEDDDYHFKRRPSKRDREGLRVSRERERDHGRARV